MKKRQRSECNNDGTVQYKMTNYPSALDSLGVEISSVALPYSAAMPAVGVPASVVSAVAIVFCGIGSSIIALWVAISSAVVLWVAASAVVVTPTASLVATSLDDVPSMVAPPVVASSFGP